MATKARTPKAERKPASPKYGYVATVKGTGEIIKNAEGLWIASSDPMAVKVAGQKRADGIADGVTVKAARYVLESSVRPGGN